MGVRPTPGEAVGWVMLIESGLSRCVVRFPHGCVCGGMCVCGVENVPLDGGGVANTPFLPIPMRHHFRDMSQILLFSPYRCDTIFVTSRKWSKVVFGRVGLRTYAAALSVSSNPTFAGCNGGALDGSRHGIS